MYLSRLTLDPRSTQARRDLSDPYEMHRTLSRAFVSDIQGMPDRFLWRLDTSGNAWSKPQVLVQARGNGNWDVLSALPHYLQAEIECKHFEADKLILPDSNYRFRLMANPTVTRQGKRFGLVTMEDQLAWLARQGERHGFFIEAALVTNSDLSVSRKVDKRISFQRTCFEGVLTVRDKALIVAALLNGIGPAKAFGCGLLSVARV